MLCRRERNAAVPEAGEPWDVLAKLVPLVDPVLSNQGNCQTYDAPNFVISVERGNLIFDPPNSVKARLGGTAVIWFCVRNPVPEYRIQWVLREIGPGIKTKVPEVTSSPGQPLKTLLSRETFVMTYSMSLQTSHAGISVKIDHRDLDGLPAERTQLAAWDQIANLFTRVLNPVQLDAATFSKLRDDARLAVETTVRMSLPEDQVQRVLSIVSAQPVR